jgi:hypothetical protein
MKKKSIIYTLSIFITVSSCSDFLDKMPDDQKTMDMVWESRKETEAYLYNVYSQLPREHSFWDEVPWVTVADETDIPWQRYFVSNMNMGNWNPESNYYDVWGAYYKAIRASFVFENNADKCQELSPNLIKQYKAEVKFLRGYYYWRLLQQFGPFVLLEAQSDLNDDWNTYARTPFETCVEYICNIMDEAEADLPFSWKATDRTWLGKPDQIACKAVKSQVLLTAASPQWNGNQDYASFKNQDGTPLVDVTYSEDKWRRAAAAAKVVIDAAESAPAGQEIRLYKNNENGDGSIFNAYKSVKDLHLVKWNCEALWSGTRENFNDLERHATPRPGGWNGLGATQRIVDAFFMINGRTIEDPLGGYSETGFASTPHSQWIENLDYVRSGDAWGHRAGEFNMYANREARFYASIVYNGRPLPQVGNADRNKYSSSSNQDGWGRVELYAGGISGSGAADHSTTGYLVYKYVSPNSSPVLSQTADWRQTVYIRLAEVYLNYIEALNEYDPAHSDIKKYWDLIRERAGLPSIFDTYPEIQGDRDKQLEYIIRERHVELCFEGDRYFTTRRRLLADKVDTDRPEEKRMFGDNGKHFGLNIQAGTSFTSTDFYQRTAFETRVFTKKMYLFPITQYEMDRNKALVQNPGW